MAARRIAAAAIGAALTLGLAAPAGAAAPAFERWWTYDRPAGYEVNAEYGIQVPTSNGSPLFCNQLRPDVPGTFPGIVYNFRPYAEATAEALQRAPDPT